MAISTVSISNTIDFQRLRINECIGRWNNLGTYDAIVITGGTIEGTPIGGVTPAAGVFTNVNVSGSLDISAGTLVLTLDQISGDYIDGGTISSVMVELSGSPTDIAHATRKDYVDGLISSSISALSLGTISTQDANNVTISGGSISGTTVSGVTISGSSTPTLDITGTSSISGTNTGDQTITLTGDVTGSGSGSFGTTIVSATINDSNLIIQDDGDTSKKFKFQSSGITTSTTRTLTVPDKDGTFAMLADVMPIGSVLPYAGLSSPSDWLLCYGQAVNRTTYSALFAIISTIYGVGDGSTTFNVPDMRGRVVAGQDDMGGASANRLTDQTGGLDGDTLGDTGGNETHTLTESQMPSHTHDREYGTGTGGTAYSLLKADNSSGAFASEAAGGDGAHNNVQPTIILNYIIKI